MRGGCPGRSCLRSWAVKGRASLLPGPSASSDSGVSNLSPFGRVVIYPISCCRSSGRIGLKLQLSLSPIDKLLLSTTYLAYVWILIEIPATDQPEQLVYVVGGDAHIPRHPSHRLENLSTIALALPTPFSIVSFLRPKHYEDSRDALVCAWLGAKYQEGDAVPYGDRTAAIWVA